MFIITLLSLALANPIPENKLSELDLGEKETPDYIINGEDATGNDFPMTGGMLLRGEIFGYAMETFICSSTLIAPDTVLLAAHCLDMDVLAFGMEIDNLEIYWTRQADLQEWDGSQQAPELPSDAIEVVDWVIHEDFSIQTLGLGLEENSDIALMFLAEPILDIEPAYLATASEAEMLAEGDHVFVVGWGQQIATEQGEASPTGSFAFKQQGESYIAEISAYEFKVGDLETDVRKCHGDSGGPSFWEGNDGLRLVGVTSHAYDDTDCFETGGVDTRIDNYTAWIEENMSARCDNGTRVWCDEAGILEPNYFQEEDEIEEDDKGLFACSAASSDLIFYMPLIGLLGLTRRRQSDASI